MKAYLSLSKSIVAQILMFALLMGFVGIVAAAPPGSPFNLGETLDPGCAPGDANCTVVPPAASGDNTDITSLGSGNIGIGTTSPNELLTIQSEGDADVVVRTYEDGGADSSALHLEFAEGDEMTPTAVSDGQTVGEVEGHAWDGSAFSTIGRISFQADDTAASGDTPGDLLFWTTPDTSSAALERMRIDSTGNVGIGATNPSAFLEIDTDSTTFPDGWGSHLRLTAENYPALWFHTENNNEGWLIGSDDGDDLTFMTTDGTSPDEYFLKFEQDGQVMVNYDALNFFDEELHIAPGDGGSSSDTAISMENNGHVYEIHVENDDTFIIYENEIEDHTESILEYDGTNNHIGFSGAEAIAGAFWNVANGATLSNGGVWTDASSRELKENIRMLELGEAYAALLALDPVRFNYKANAQEDRVGFIAEDVPELVATQGRKGLSSMDITGVLTRVVQDQHERLEHLEEQNQTVMEQLDDLRQLLRNR